LLPVSIQFTLVMAGNDRPESPRISKRERSTITHEPPNMNVVSFPGKRFARQELPAHSKPNNQPAPRPCTNRELLALAKDAIDDTRVKQVLGWYGQHSAFSLSTWMCERTNDVAPSDVIELQRPPDQETLQPTSNALHLRQFWHL